MNKVTIYGERCSGTNYLQELLLLNFDIEIVWNYGWKHFFGFNDLSKSNDVLFIGIVRNLEDWINSLYRDKHHLPNELTKNVDSFLTNTFYSMDEQNNEIMTDRNMETGERYKNIFELRRIKNKFLIEKMPTLVKKYCLITYDDLTNNFIDIMNKLRDCGLKIKNGIEFPLNVSYYKKEKNKTFVKKVNKISREKIYESMIEKNELLFYENLLFPPNSQPQSQPVSTAVESSSIISHRVLPKIRDPRSHLQTIPSVYNPPPVLVQKHPVRGHGQEERRGDREERKTINRAPSLHRLESGVESRKSGGSASSHIGINKPQQQFNIKSLSNRQFKILNL
jgi:hypothetical protein